MTLNKKILIITSTIIAILVLGFYFFKDEDKYPIEDNNLESKVKSNNIIYEINKNGKKSEIIDSVITDKKYLTLTFQGMGDKKSLTNLLNELDRLNIKATFFVSGIKVSEEPDLANMIVDRGHEIGNATLSGVDLTKVDYTKKIKEIEKSHEQIKKYTGVDTKYLRPGHKSIDEDIQIAAFECGYENIITYNINPKDSEGKSAQYIAESISVQNKRGSIITLNLDIDPNLYKSIEAIQLELRKKEFELISMKELMNIYEERKENKYILANDWYKQKTDEQNEEALDIIENGPRDQKKITLTFDDWASEDTVDSILDTLDEYNIKATFFLRVKGIENNPSLAYTIAQRGHEIASHTYEHIPLNTMSKEEIKTDIIKSHEIITDAINQEPKKYLRPPQGVITDEAAKAINEYGYKVIMYGPSALDWKEEHSANYIKNYMLNRTKNGDILLLHILDRINTPEALPGIIEGLHAKGYKFVTVSELIGDI
ncbi:MAG: polysaccharide deacetylase family protein [Romboutsia sp.]|uniref:polysaccharide deacetylase family protein n=1 Tax=Romboutsia sp. TaxID=1965302 RepID=UPI003F2E29B7